MQRRPLPAGCISTHAPLAGRDEKQACLTREEIVFQPTRPLRGATLVRLSKPTTSLISTHAPLAGRDEAPNQVLNLVLISTHAPLAGRDDRGGLRCKLRSYFNPRAPCGARQADADDLQAMKQFQPTRPLRGATKFPLPLFLLSLDFNPRAPCGARPFSSNCFNLYSIISTHAPLAGRDAYILGKSIVPKEISTHAPLAGRDLTVLLHKITHCKFQPTRPLRGATTTTLLESL